MLAPYCLASGPLDLDSHLAFNSESCFDVSCKFILSADIMDDSTGRSVFLEELTVAISELSCIWILTSGFCKI